MKFVTISAVILNSLIVSTALYETGCATSGNQRSANTRTTMKAVENDYVQAIAQVDATNDSLEVILRPEPSDKKKPLERYSANVSKMKDLEKRLFEHSDKMHSQQNNYFEEWRMEGNSYTNPEIQALSDRRRTDLTETFSRIGEASVGVKGDFKDYMSNITQIKVFLSTDLTPKGIEAISVTAQKAVMDGNNLKQDLNRVLARIHDARSEISQGDHK